MAECCGSSSDTKGGDLYRSPPPPVPVSKAPGYPRREFIVGFACDFINPPRELRTECPICLYILREPYQATCCGTIYCRLCIERVHTDKKPCPACRNVDFDVFVDRGLRNALYGFKVRCTNKEQGCEWIGELRHLDEHLNLNPQPEHRFFGCEFAEETCILCKQPYPRGMLEEHEMKKCLQRPYTCEYCNNYTGTCEDVVGKHWNECPFRAVPCANECGVCPLRKDFDYHLNYECELRVHISESSSQMVPLSEVHKYIEAAVKTKVSSLIADYFKKTPPGETSKEVQFLRAETQALRSELETMKIREAEDHDTINMLKTHLSIVPVVFTLDDYEKRLIQLDVGWTSPGFYTHPRGYRMCLLVDVGGGGPTRGSCLSVFLNFTKGEYDSQLNWPFRGTVSIQILNQRDEGSLYEEVIKYHATTPIATSGRVLEEGRTSRPWGKVNFISHEKLNSDEFVLNDTLKFRVSNVALEM